MIARTVVVVAKKPDPHPMIGIGSSTEEDPIDCVVRVVPRGWAVVVTGSPIA
jgi:hypothetical protein